MVIDFSKINIKKRPNFILKSLDGNAIGYLSHVLNPEGKLCYNEISEINFEYPSQVDGKKLDEYDLLTGMRLVDVQGYGLFMLRNPEETDDGVKKIKSCTCYSLEYEFTNKTISLDEGTYNFWNPLAPESTILGIILSEMPFWSIGTVSQELIGKYRTFNVDNENIYNFMKDTLQETYECIFDFDTYNRVINVRHVSDRLQTKPIYISLDNLAKEIEIEENTDDLVTVLDVNGAEGVNIRSVNPMGENKIYNLDAYMNEKYFSEEMIAKWSNWKNTFNSYQQPYYNLVVEQNMQVSRYVTESAALTELYGELKALEAKRAAIIQGIAVDSALQSDLNTVNKQISSKETEIATQEGLIKSIQVRIDNIISQLKEINKKTSFSAFFTSSELANLSRYFKYGTLTDTTFVSTSTGGYASEPTSVRGLNGIFNITGLSEAVKPVSYTNEITFYSFRGGNIKETNSNFSISANIVSGTLQANSDNTFILSVYLNSGTYNTSNNFTGGTLSVTGTLNGKISTTNTSLQVNVTGSSVYLTHDVTEYQKMAIEWELFEYGVECLSKMSSPTFSFTVSSVNFFALDEFVSFAKQFSLGEKLYLKIGENVLCPIVVGVSFDFDDMSRLTLDFGDSYNLDSPEFTLKDILGQAVSMGNSLDFNQYNYSNFVNSGAKTQVKDFMQSAIDTMKNAILSGTNNEITIDQAGIRARKYDESSGTYSPKQLWIAYNALMFTNDNWNSATIGIGEFVDKNLGSIYGIVAPAIVGTILAGTQLVIESEKQDGGVAVFKVDAEGASLHNASFNLYGSTGGRIDLGAVFGIVGGSDKNTLFYYDSKGQPTGVRTVNGRTVTRIADLASNDTPNANFWIDMHGDVYLKGTIDAVAGIFRGSLEVGGPTAFRVDKQGNLSIGGTATNPNFYVDANGNMRARNADITGRVDASSLYVAGRNILTNTNTGGYATSTSQISPDFLDLYGITIRNKSTNAVSFQVTTNGQVNINGNITMGAGSSINWATVTEVNPTYSEAYGYAQSAYNRADSAYSRANSAYNLADAAYDEADYAYELAWQNRLTDVNVFNVLTSGGTRFGIFSDSTSGRLYINANYIKTGSIDADIITLSSTWGGFCCATGSDGINTTYGAKIYGSAGRNSKVYMFVSNQGSIMSASGANLYVAGSSIVASTEISVRSDEKFKNHILYDMDKYEKFFMKLPAASFCINEHEDTVRHFGFVAQDVKKIKEECGILDYELGLLQRLQKENDDGVLEDYYAIKYGELISLCVHMIQKLYHRIDNIEKSIH